MQFIITYEAEKAGAISAGSATTKEAEQGNGASDEDKN